MTTLLLKSHVRLVLAVAIIALPLAVFSPPRPASALSCMAPTTFADAVQQTEVVLEVLPKKITATDRASYRWDMEVVKVYKGNVQAGSTVSITESVWPSTDDVTSRFSAGKSALVLLGLNESGALTYGLCEFYSRTLSDKPLTAEEQKVLDVAEPRACTMDAKLCPDGIHYVGRDSYNNCAFKPCPDTKECAPYVCKDGTRIDRCAEDGTVINYFAAPCLTHGGEVEAGAFSDVPASHSNAEAIAYVKAAGMVSGYPDGAYRPDQTINRAEFVKILMLALFPTDRMNACFRTPFFDVTESTIDNPGAPWYIQYLCAASDEHLITGYPDYTFRPSNPINFAEAATILGKGFFLREEVQGRFQAPDTSAEWFKKYVTLLADKNAIPLSISRFDQLITRGEMAEMIYRLKAAVTDKPSQTYGDLR